MNQQVREDLRWRVANHLEALHTSSRLTAIFRKMYRPKFAKVRPEKVIQALHKAGIKCVLIGTHGIGSYRDQPRATHDVDVLVRKKEVKKAVQAIHEAYPKLGIEDLPSVARFIDPAAEYEVIDVVKPVHRVFRFYYKYAIPVGRPI